MHAGFKEARDERHRQGALLESVQDDIKPIVEAVSPELEKTTGLQKKLEDHDTKLIQHGLRLTKLESA